MKKIYLCMFICMHSVLYITPQSYKQEHIVSAPSSSLFKKATKVSGGTLSSIWTILLSCNAIGNLFESHQMYKDHHVLSLLPQNQEYFAFTQQYERMTREAVISIICSTLCGICAYRCLVL